MAFRASLIKKEKSQVFCIQNLVANHYCSSHVISYSMLSPVCNDVDRTIVVQSCVRPKKKKKPQDNFYVFILSVFWSTDTHLRLQLHSCCD